ncbi:YqhR family membrane protein [Pontibacillus yanchengensis]|uniref:YqhR family membrane protein n=1 Tax=Pontibacillus yanchengensis TaxID=462910 RepID=UPI00301E2BFC
MEQEQKQVQNEELEQNKTEKPVSSLSKALITGFVGGLLWSFVGVVTYFFNFSSVSAASFIIRSWIQTDWTGSWIGEFLGMVAIGLLSLGVAVIYYGLLRKTHGLFPPILFGVALWFIVMYLFNPIFATVPTVYEMDSNTIVTTLCIYILYGTFIGYSISYDYEQFEHGAS